MFDDVKVTSFSRNPFHVVFSVQGDKVHIRDSGVFDEKGWWFTAVRDNRAVRFVASADALVPRGIGLDVDVVIDPWNSKWPTKMLNEEELSRVDAGDLFFRRLNSNQDVQVEYVPVKYISEISITNAIRPLHGTICVSRMCFICVEADQSMHVKRKRLHSYIFRVGSIGRENALRMHCSLFLFGVKESIVPKSHLKDLACIVPRLWLDCGCSHYLVWRISLLFCSLARTSSMF